MLWTLALILFVFWLIATVSAYTMDGHDSRAAGGGAAAGGVEPVYRYGRAALALREPSASRTDASEGSRPLESCFH